jgi:4-amino-4-deoxy-L-arabinose transferase-like glycosyltransferase
LSLPTDASLAAGAVRAGPGVLSPERAARLIGLGAFVAGIALLYVPTLGHDDHTDSLLYRVVVRHMLRDHTWTDLRYLGPPMEHYRDHLPFGFWPLAIVARLFGEAALPFVGFAWSVGTLALLWRCTAKLLGEASAAVAVIILSTTDSFFFYGGRVLLDPPVVFWSCASAALVLATRLSRWQWLLATGCAAIAVMVKGPYGGVLFAAAVLARAWSDRSWMTLVVGVIAGVVAAVPALSFLLFDRWSGHQGWWHGYVEHQIIASALGERSDGTGSLLFPLLQIAGRFWPGFPLLVVAVALTAVSSWRRGLLGEARERPFLLVMAFVFASVAILTIPQRKVWNHLLVGFPGLSMAAGAVGGPLLKRLLRAELPRRATAWIAGSVALLLAAFSASGGLTRAMVGSGCVFSRTLRPAVEPHRGERLLLVSSPTNWRALAELAAEFDLDGVVSADQPAGKEIPREIRLAVVDEHTPSGLPAAWKEVARAEGWIVLAR